jgi:hypothetical protein
MKKPFYFFFFLLIILSCKDETECCVNPTIAIKLKFTHNWDGVELSSSDFNEFKFRTANNDLISISRLRYLVSNVLFNNTIESSSTIYSLIDIDKNETTLLVTGVPISKVNALAFTFGFRDEDNLDGVYADLNSASFNVPEMLGGGYHYMQFDGKFKDSNNADANFNYHAIRSADITDPDNIILQDTSFEVDLGNIEITENTTIEIKMNVAEWFKNPNTWNLKELNTVLMPNFDAQILMNENGQSVFSLGEITSN